MPDDLIQIIAMTLLAGAAIPAGALLACVEHFRPRWLETEFRHSVIAFGGGALLSAVALVLVPEGMKLVSPVWVVVCFGAGGVAFMLLDAALAKSRTAASQLVAMLSDFLPEAISLGATFATSPKGGFLLAILMALQNLPEGFNAYREMATHRAMPRRRILFAFALMALLGPIAGLLGYWLLANSMSIVGGLMLFSGGGILYLMMQDIAPQAALERHWAPPLGAVAGFLLGMVGQMVIG